MKILLIGRLGQLGWELNRSLLPIGELIAVDYPEIDLTKGESIKNWIQEKNPTVIINAAAYTAVDQAETEKDLARLINTDAPRILAQEAQSINALFVHYSTDFVFDGKSEGPYRETDHPQPLNIYGETKLAGEQGIREVGGEAYIFRTSWLYSTRKDCFLTKVLSWAHSKQELRIVSDQVGSPTWSRTLADTTAQWLAKMQLMDQAWRETKSGVYHLAGNGSVSRYDWAKEILQRDPRKSDQICTSVKPARSEEFETAASRPKNSALDCSLFQETFGLFMSDWLDSLDLAMHSLG